MADGKWTSKLGKASKWLSLTALGVAAIGLTLARYDIVDKLPGFYSMLIGGLIAAIGAVLGMLSLLLSLRGNGASRGPAILGLVLSLPLVAFLATRPIAADGAPAIHDITTDLANPPEFQALELREDNLVGVDTIENWRAIHGEAYGDIEPLQLSRPVAAVVADAHQLALEQGWDVAAFDPEAGRIEATASVSYIRFKDDIVIEVTPSANSEGSIVNMRSVSRLGVSDLGVNARRIRSFLAALQAS